MRATVVELAYLASAVLFVLALKGLSHPRSAVRGNLLGALGMLLAVAVTLFDRRIVRLDILAAGLALGAVFGLVLALKIRMTAMPELVALFNGLGGGASALVAGSALIASRASLPLATASVASGLVGTVTFAGSLMGMAKLFGWMGGAPFSVAVQRALLALLLAAVLGAGLGVLLLPEPALLYGALVAAAALAGLVLVLPVGGADMPVVIALLNACSGLAASATGFVLLNQALIVSGSLVGASGLILTRIMCRAMNRSLASVLFAAAPAREECAPGAVADRPVKATSADEVAMILEASRRVVIVPGYGMAVAQAQHAASALAKKLRQRGVSVVYAIHPVAGRMPGHMNVLLAEADVPYDQLKDLESVNPELVTTDVALVIGANDVVNPRARTDPGSPLYGMPIVDVDRAKTVVVLKRSLRPGFAGVANPLFTADATVMLFGDAKESLLAISEALSD